MTYTCYCDCYLLYHSTFVLYDYSKLYHVHLSAMHLSGISSWFHYTFKNEQEHWFITNYYRKYLLDFHAKKISEMFFSVSHKQALKEDGTIDVDSMKTLIKAAKPLIITFSRAFDDVKVSLAIVSYSQF